MHPIRIGLIGDRNLEVRAHVAIPKALEIAGKGLPRPVEPVWLSTPTLVQAHEEKLAGLNGLWCVPNSPYESTEGALLAIRFARERALPFLGTCGGFQHALLEYARHVLGLAGARHEETSPMAEKPFISALACSLVGESGLVRFTPASLAARAYAKDKATEEYHCNYSLNPAYRELLDPSGMKVTGVDEAGEVRIVELSGHPFFVATLFQPELSAYRGVPHPLIRAFAEAVFQDWHRVGARIAG